MQGLSDNIDAGYANGTRTTTQQSIIEWHFNTLPSIPQSTDTQHYILVINADSFEHAFIGT